MKDIPLNQFGTKLHFGRLQAEELRQSGSFNLVDSGGEFVAVLVVPASAEKKMQMQSLAEAGNQALGRE